MKSSAVVRLRFSSKRKLEVISRALEPEIAKPATTRSKSTLQREDSFLILKVKASDTVALRATLNAYLRWVSSILDVLELLKADSKSLPST
jgi:KEOPS complex subunit Pcc1